MCEYLKLVFISMSLILETKEETLTSGKKLVFLDPRNQHQPAKAKSILNI